jgi:hypothetical protein
MSSNNGEYIGTAEDGTASDVIKNYVENQEQRNKKMHISKLKQLIFNNLY